MLPEKILQRLSDPVFYRKRSRDFVRRFKGYDDDPKATSPDVFGDMARVAVAVAHPDDETFGSGLICELAGRGAKVSVLCLTRGEGGPPGDSTRERLGLVRAGEMESACEALGVEELVFLDHIDPVAGKYRVYAPEVSGEDLARQVRPLIENVDLVISHGSSGEYWHPGHLLVHDAVRRALQSMLPDDGPAWLTFLARHPGHPLPRLVNWDDPVFLRFDASKHSEQRTVALACHRSQLALFGRFARGSHEDFVRATAVESYCLRRTGRLQVAESTDEGEGEGNH